MIENCDNATLHLNSSQNDNYNQEFVLKSKKSKQNYTATYLPSSRKFREIDLVDFIVFF